MDTVAALRYMIQLIASWPVTNEGSTMVMIYDDMASYEAHNNAMEEVGVLDHDGCSE